MFCHGLFAKFYNFRFVFLNSKGWSKERWKMERFNSSVFEVSVAGFALGHNIGQLLAVLWLVAFDAWWTLKIQSFQEVSITSRTDSLNQPVKSIIVQKANVCGDQIDDHWNDWEFHLFGSFLLLLDCRVGVDTNLTESSPYKIEKNIL